jgi:hypothetical protein
MKITSAFCDVHTTVPMAAAVIELLSPMGDRNTLHTVRCSDPTCHRNYTQADGYFDSVVGCSPDFGDPGQKLRCGLNHEVEYMVLTEIGGELMWACPVQGCDKTLPFKFLEQSNCPYEDCGKPAPHTFETAKLKTMLDRRDVELYCIYCDRTWKASEVERNNLAKFLGEKMPVVQTDPA